MIQILTLGTIASWIITQLMTNTLHQPIVYCDYLRTKIHLKKITPRNPDGSLTGFFHNVEEEATRRLQPARWLPFARSPAAMREAANAAFFERPQQIKTNARSALGTCSILDFPQLLMGKGDICCDIVACLGRASLKGAVYYINGRLGWQGWLKQKEKKSKKAKSKCLPRVKFAFDKKVHAYDKGGSHADSLRLCIWSAKPEAAGGE